MSWFTDGAGAAMDEHYHKERLRMDKVHKQQRLDRIARKKLEEAK